MIEHIEGFFADFSVAATLPSSAVVRGIFDNGTSEALQALGGKPQFTGQTDDLSGLAYGAVIVIAGDSFVVRENRPDATGISVLTLEAQA